MVDSVGSLSSRLSIRWSLLEDICIALVVDIIIITHTHTATDPEGLYRFPLKHPLLDNICNTTKYLQHIYISYSNSGSGL